MLTPLEDEKVCEFHTEPSSFFLISFLWFCFHSLSLSLSLSQSFHTWFSLIQPNSKTGSSKLQSKREESKKIKEREEERKNNILANTPTRHTNYNIRRSVEVMFKDSFWSSVALMDFKTSHKKGKKRKEKKQTFIMKNFLGSKGFVMKKIK